MILSQASKYALRAAIHLARYGEQPQLNRDNILPRFCKIWLDMACLLLPRDVVVDFDYPDRGRMWNC